MKSQSHFRMIRAIFNYVNVYYPISLNNYTKLLREGIFPLQEAKFITLKKKFRRLLNIAPDSQSLKKLTYYQKFDLNIKNVQKLVTNKTMNCIYYSITNISQRRNKQKQTKFTALQEIKIVCTIIL